jgi:hypothetical protein
MDLQAILKRRQAEREAKLGPLESQDADPVIKIFSPACRNCARFDIYEGIAWCFYQNSYRNHKFLISCPGHISQNN